jgi:hypothetical protein
MNNFQTKEVAICDCGINGVQYVAVGFVDTKVAIALCGVVGADDEAYSREIAAHIATLWNTQAAHENSLLCVVDVSCTSINHTAIVLIVLETTTHCVVGSSTILIQNVVM